MAQNTHGQFSVAVFLLILLGVGIGTRVNGIAEGTEIILSALVGIGLLVKSWLDI
jgi:hypothetical protein